jgi:hypothetical protein
VHASFTGGGGGIAGTNTWQVSVPTAGTKTIANGDLVAIAIQMTARVSDNVSLHSNSTTAIVARPVATQFTGGSYSSVTGVPNVLITFSDGALGWISGGSASANISTRTWNSGSANAEYGQLFNLPFPTRVYGFYGWVASSADFDMVLYSDPLGTPVAEKTVSVDASTVGAATGRRIEVIFPSPYDVAANAPIGAVFKPGGSNISSYYKTLHNAAHRIVDPWGTSGYGIARASGAFAPENSNLDHYYVGLITGAFDDGAGSGGGHIATRQQLGM